MAAVLELVAGSYEQVTFGYRVKTDEKVHCEGVILLYNCLVYVLFTDPGIVSDKKKMI